MEEFDVCPDCQGAGELRRSWNVTHWSMTECGRCSGFGGIPEQDVMSIMADCLSLVLSDANAVAEAGAKLNHELVSRNIFILRRRDLDAARQAFLDEFVAKLTKLQEAAEEPAKSDSVTGDAESERLAGVLRQAAAAREAIVPGSPQAQDFRAAAELLAPNEIDGSSSVS